jgi:hypothetical protein
MHLRDSSCLCVRICVYPVINSLLFVSNVEQCKGYCPGGLHFRHLDRHRRTVHRYPAPYIQAYCHRHSQACTPHRLLWQGPGVLSKNLINSPRIILTNPKYVL